MYICARVLTGTAFTTAETWVQTSICSGRDQCSYNALDTEPDENPRTAKRANGDEPQTHGSEGRNK